MAASFTRARTSPASERTSHLVVLADAEAGGVGRGEEQRVAPPPVIGSTCRARPSS
jgi:hypothetical protein